MVVDSVVSTFPPQTFSFPTGLILRTVGPFNVFILLNGWICLHMVCWTKPALSRFSNALNFIALFIHSFIHSFQISLLWSRTCLV